MGDSEISEAGEPTREVPTSKRSEAALALVVLLVAATFLSLIISFALKQPCLTNNWGPPDYIQYRSVCYSDIQALYGERHLNTRAFPYVEETSYEYPVVIGLEMWTASNFATTFEEYFIANLPFLGLAALLALVGLLGAVGPRPRVLWYALGTPLIFYAFHNWDLLAVAPLTLAMWAWARRRDFWAGVALGVGAAAKLFPGYAVPVLLIARWREPGATRESRWRDALKILGGAAVSWLAFNVPIIVADANAHGGEPKGWLGIFKFHARRTPDFGTAWYWISDKLVGVGRAPLLKFLPVLVVGALALIGATAAMALTRRKSRFSLARNDAIGIALIGLVLTLLTLWLMSTSEIAAGPASQEYKQVVDLISFALFAIGTAGLLAYQWIRRRDPWSIAGAIITLFLLTSKVHSPQYAIWIVTLFVIVNVPWWLIVAYLAADAVLLYSGFLWFATSPQLQSNAWQSVFIWSVYGRTLALVGLLIWFTLFGRDLTRGPGALRRESGGRIDSPPVADEARSNGQALDGEEKTDELVPI